ncbi:Glutathione S-transferase zeta-1 [Globomyces sp. JEL0801]|nr:Glutathione S-transferase zeta-1 [Globomyces sp. JEL0801]
MPEDKQLKLYTYWRSSCSYRVRIVMYLKGIEFESIPINLVKGEQKQDKYSDINPNATVPSLQFPTGQLVVQSSAIIELLEELYPDVPLFPSDPFEKAKVRGIMNLISCDIQPIQNLRVLNYVGETKMEWGKHFITSGFKALEKTLEKTAGSYCVGNTVTIADAYLVPQVYNAIRFSVNMSEFPIIQAVYGRLIEMDAFKKAHPSEQVDAVGP